MTTKPNEPEALPLRDLIAEVAADLSTGNPFWTAKLLADALITRGIGIVPAQPVADAGGVTDADKKLLARIVSWVHCPTIMGVEQVERMISAHRLQSVAAATAAKDARDPLRDIVFRYIDRMNDVAPECGDPADRIIGEFARDVNAVLKAERAALSQSQDQK